MPKITDRFVAKLVPPPKGNKKRVCDVYWDDSLKGFGVYITANEAVSYFFNYRTKAGRLRRISIGSPPTYTATAARNVATRYKLKVDQGGDPLADKEGERDAPTVADLARSTSTLTPSPSDRCHRRRIATPSSGRSCPP